MATLTVANIVKRLQNVFPGLPGRALYELFTTTRTDLVAVEARATALETYTAVAATAATLAVTAASHHGRTIYLNKADGIAATLPAATGSGAVFTFVVAVTASGGNYVIKVADATDEFIGRLIAPDTDAATAQNHWVPADNDDTITLNGTATGGKIGDIIVCTDVASNVYHVWGIIGQSGGSEATPFSNTVS